MTICASEYSSYIFLQIIFLSASLWKSLKPQVICFPRWYILSYLCEYVNLSYIRLPVIILFLFMDSIRLLRKFLIGLKYITWNARENREIVKSQTLIYSYFHSLYFMFFIPSYSFTVMFNESYNIIDFRMWWDVP